MQQIVIVHTTLFLFWDQIELSFNLSSWVIELNFIWVTEMFGQNSVDLIQFEK